MTKDFIGLRLVETNPYGSLNNDIHAWNIGPSSILGSKTKFADIWTTREEECPTNENRFYYGPGWNLAPIDSISIEYI